MGIPAFAGDFIAAQQAPEGYRADEGDIKPGGGVAEENTAVMHLESHIP